MDRRIGRIPERFDSDFQEVAKIGHSIDHMAAELYRGKLIGFVENIKDNRWHVLLRSGNDTGIDPELLIDSVSQYLGHSLSVAVSDRFTDWREWIEYDRRAGELLGLRYYREDDHLFQGEPPEATLSDAMFVWKKSMTNKLSSLLFEQAEDHLADLKRVVGPPYPRPTLVHNVLEDVLFQLKQCSERTGRLLPEAQFHRTELLNCASLTEAVHLLHGAIQALQDPIAREKSGQEKKKFVDATELFIQEHRFEEISLNG